MCFVLSFVCPAFISPFVTLFPFLVGGIYARLVLCSGLQVLNCSRFYPSLRRTLVIVNWSFLSDSCGRNATGRLVSLGPVPFCLFS